MNQASSAPGTSLVPDSTDLFTTVHLVWIAVLAVLVIAAILWGVHLKRARKAGEREIAQHNAELGDRADPGDRIEDEPSPAPTPAPTMSPPRLDPDVAPLGSSSQPVDVGPGEVAVTQLKGLGPKVAQRLAELGITTVGQIAALTDDEAADLDAKLGSFSGRMARDRWQEQARFLAAGDKAGFEAVFGRF